MTIGARIACLSSFYKFLIRMDIVASNPCDALERPRIEPSPPSGLSAEEIRRLLDAVLDTSESTRREIRGRVKAQAKAVVETGPMKTAS